MRSVLAGLALAVMLSAAPSVAFADEGDDGAEAIVPDDPGVAALHEAITAMKDARIALRDQCPNSGTAECRAKAKELRAAFKDARRAAIAKHHEFRVAQQAARAETRDAAKAEARAARDAAKAARWAARGSATD